MIRNGDALIQQPARILAKVQNQTLHVVFPEPFEIVFQFFAGVLVKLLNVDISNSGLYPERVFNALPRYLIADDVKDQWFLYTFPGDFHLDRSSPLPFQHVGDLSRSQAVGFLVIHLENRIAGPDTGLIRRRPIEGLNDDGPAVARRNRHSHSVIVTLLFFSKSAELFRIEEAGVGIERSGHTRYCALIDRLLGRNLVREIVLDDVENLREALQTGLDIIFGAGGGRISDTGAVQASQHGAK
jgi:hypothetical protein